MWLPFSRKSSSKSASSSKLRSRSKWRRHSKKLFFGAMLLIAFLVLPLSLWMVRQSQDNRGDAAFCSGAYDCEARCLDGHVTSDICPAYGAYSSCAAWAHDACGPRGGLKEILRDGGTGKNYGDSETAPAVSTNLNCQKHSDCVDSNYCGKNKKCQVRVKRAEACSSSAITGNKAPIDGDFNAVCRGSNVCKDGICKPADAGKFCVKGTAGACNPGEFCASAGFCRPVKEDGGSCDEAAQCQSGVCMSDGKCGCVRDGKLNNSVCPSGRYCNWTSNTTGACEAKRASTQPCVWNAQCISNRCNIVKGTGSGYCK